MRILGNGQIKCTKRSQITLNFCRQTFHLDTAANIILRNTTEVNKLNNPLIVVCHTVILMRFILFDVTLLSQGCIYTLRIECCCFFSSLLFFILFFLLQD